MTPFDWQAIEDGALTDVDRQVILAYLEAAPERAVRDASRKLRRFFLTTAPEYGSI